ncbi:hypothetical protein KAW48_02025 [candidate division WOR-3 bacterium]|nr:hypothetical protein [candidate division WOR-3 bacterium]
MFKRISTITLFIALVIFGFIVNGCGTKSPPEPGRYYNKGKGFSIKFPGEWEIKEGPGQEEPAVEATSPWENEADMFSEFIAIYVDELPGTTSLKDYFNELNFNTENDLAHYQEKERGNISIDNTDTKWIIFTYTLAEGAMQSISYLLIKDNKAYMISCNSEPEKFDMYRSKFKEAVQTFRFE